MASTAATKLGKQPAFRPREPESAEERKMSEEVYRTMKQRFEAMKVEAYDEYTANSQKKDLAALERTALRVEYDKHIRNLFAMLREEAEGEIEVRKAQSQWANNQEVDESWQHRMAKEQQAILDKIRRGTDDEGDPTKVAGPSTSRSFTASTARSNIAASAPSTWVPPPLTRDKPPSGPNPIPSQSRMHAPARPAPTPRQPPSSSSLRTPTTPFISPSNPILTPRMSNTTLRTSSESSIGPSTSGAYASPPNDSRSTPKPFPRSAARPIPTSNTPRPRDAFANNTTDDEAYGSPYERWMPTVGSPSKSDAASSVAGQSSHARRESFSAAYPASSPEDMRNGPAPSSSKLWNARPRRNEPQTEDEARVPGGEADWASQARSGVSEAFFASQREMARLMEEAKREVDAAERAGLLGGDASAPDATASTPDLEMDKTNAGAKAPPTRENQQSNFARQAEEIKKRSQHERKRTPILHGVPSTTSVAPLSLPSTSSVNGTKSALRRATPHPNATLADQASTSSGSGSTRGGSSSPAPRMARQDSRRDVGAGAAAQDGWTTDIEAMRQENRLWRNDAEIWRRENDKWREENELWRKELARREEEVRRREGELLVREGEVAKREEAVKKREDELSKREVEEKGTKARRKN